MLGCAYAVVQVHDAGGLQRADGIKLDVIGAEPVEEPSPVAKEHRYEVDLHLVEQAGT
jgi:hypothetical protein